LCANFTQPCSFGLIRCQSPRKDYIQAAISHAVSDALSLAPVRSDLISLYIDECSGGSVQSRRSGLAPLLPPIPDALELLERRLRSALLHPSDGDGGAEGGLYIGGWESETASSWGYRRMIRVRQSAGLALRHACEVLQLPQDVALMVALACCIARCDGERIVRLTLTVPMRDGPGEAAVTGLFADWRDLDIHTHPLQSLLSVMHQVAEDVRRRRWRRCDVAQVSQRILFNLVGSQLASSDRGFSPVEEVGSMRPPLPHRQVYTSLTRPLEVQGWQTGAAEWTLVLRLRGNRYPPSWARKFAGSLERVIQEVSQNPLAPVHSE